MSAVYIVVARSAKESWDEPARLEAQAKVDEQLADGGEFVFVPVGFHFHHPTTRVIPNGFGVRELREPGKGDAE